MTRALAAIASEGRHARDGNRAGGRAPLANTMDRPPDLDYNTKREGDLCLRVKGAANRESRVGALITVAVTAVAITAMLLVRRNAPDGSYFADGDRASGVFGVLATGFSSCSASSCSWRSRATTSRARAPRQKQTRWCSR
jgi:hypothetical protein